MLRVRRRIQSVRSPGDFPYRRNWDSAQSPGLLAWLFPDPSAILSGTGALWPLLDLSGNGNDFDDRTDVSGQTQSIFPELHVVARRQNSSSTFHLLLAANASQLQRTGDISYGAIFYFDALAAVNLFVCEGGSEAEADNFLYEMRMTNTSGDIRYVHEFGGGSNQLNTFTSTGISALEPVSIYITRNTAKKEVKLYVNANLIGTYTYTSQPTGGSTSDIDLDLPGDSYAWDYRFYDRELPPEQIPNPKNPETLFELFWQPRPMIVKAPAAAGISAPVALYHQRHHNRAA